LIKIIFGLCKMPNLSLAEFHRYWFEEHAPLVRQHAEALRLRRYTQSHSFWDHRIAPSIEARGDLAEPFDGVAELWWDSIEDIIAVGTTKEGRAAGRALLADEQKFIDLPNSTLFYAREHVIVGAN
jgi:uncharacterized protein (TIGR02118 family)